MIESEEQRAERINYVHKYWRWLDKKLGTTTNGPATLQRRTMNTAISVLVKLFGIPFEKISSTLYFFCEDIGMRNFSRRYESQMELAVANEDAFVKNLHKFFNDTAAFIKKENLYADYFDFISLVSQLRSHMLGNKSDEEKMSVIDCYFSMLLQQSCYLKKNKFDYATCVCGMTTDGRLMEIPESFPTIDLPGYELERMAYEGRISCSEELQAIIPRLYAKYNLPYIKTANDIEFYSNQDRLEANQRAAMMPFINETNVDLVLHENYFTGNYPQFFGIQLPDDTLPGLQEKLKHRCATLPANGALYKFRNTEKFDQVLVQELLLKETFYNESVYMLYKAKLSVGELSGYYETKTGYFFTVLYDAPEERVPEAMAKLVLYFYACAVTRDGPRMFKELSNHCYMATSPESVLRLEFVPEYYRLGGKPKNLYDGEKDTAPDAGHARKGNDDYESVERPIQGYIRKLGPGRTASDAAIEYAASLGYELMPDETFVRPFVKHVLKLRLKDTEGMTDGE